MIETASALDLAVDGGLERQSWRHDPINYGNLQTLHVICTGGVDTLLYLHEALA
jgi:hypothetical protein